MALRTETRVCDPAALSFGKRMRYERERRKISIASIAETTKILGALLEGLENDDVSRWPTGFYRRAFMRAYASAVGLDPEATVKEFLERFPDPESPVPPSAIVPVSVSASGAPPTASGAAEDRMHLAPGAFRIGAPRLGAWFSDGALVRGMRLRCLAAAVDLFAVFVLGVALYAVIGMLWAPLAVAAAVYYAGGVLLLGNTPGVCLFADPEKTLKKGGRVYLHFLRHQQTDRGVADSTV